MKRIVTAVLLAGVLLGTVGSGYAADARIGYVDMRRVLTETNAGKRVKGEIEKTVKQRQESLQREEQALKDMQQSYDKDKLLLSEAQKQAKQKEFEEKVKAYQQARAAAQREIDQKEQEFTRKAIPEIRAIIRDLAREEKLMLVFEKHEQPVLYAADGPDLTERVIQRLDAQGGG